MNAQSQPGGTDVAFRHAGSRLTPRARLALATARGATVLSRSLRLGSGTTVGGASALVVDPGLLARLAAGREVALVWGTNGKTTTSRMLAEAWRTRGPVVSNVSGANLPAGHVAALAANAGARHAVLEVDEAHMGAVAAAVRPRVVLLLNLTRDQLDRVSEVRGLAERWRHAASALPGDATVVANADDPLVTWAASSAGRVIWVAAGQLWTADSVLCPDYGDVLLRSEQSWRCDRCGLRSAEPDYALVGYHLRVPGAAQLPLHLVLPGRANRANAAFAVAAAAQLGVPPEQAAHSLARLASVAGRYSTVQLAGARLRLLLAKNPAGWLETLDLLEHSPGPVVIGINARAADGRDTSWLWDVPFERLRGRQIFAIGDRRTDLAVRLRYAEVEVSVVDDLEHFLDDRTGDDRSFECVLNYTAFHDLLGRMHGG